MPRHKKVQLNTLKQVLWKSVKMGGRILNGDIFGPRKYTEDQILREILVKDVFSRILMGRPFIKSNI